MIKIILFGSQGMLGNYIFKYLNQLNKYNIVCINRNQYNVTEDSINKLENILNEQIERYIDKYYVINCIGLIPQIVNLNNNSNNITNINKLYIETNTIFPRYLSILCDKLNFIMIHPSTDCVFSGTKGNYIETDMHDESNMYGISKSLGESEKCMVIRTSIIGHEIKNKASLLEWIISNKNGKIRGYNNHYWNGITCLEFAKLIEHLIHNNINWTGVRHIFSPNKLSKFDLLRLIINIYNLNIDVESYKDGDKIIDKSLNTIYDNIYIIKDLNGSNV
jgi:dTDP-4-dehydrorhamnose reductase